MGVTRMTDQQDRLSPVVENGMGPASTGGSDEPERAGQPVEPTQVTSSETIPAAGQVITNPISGERIVIRESAAQTGGRLLAFDLFLPPGAHVPARHVHPVQEERFTVVAGRMRFRLGRFGRRTILAHPGDTVLVAAGTAHWFGNAGAGVAHARVEVRPALRMEELFESAAAMGRTRLFPGARLPRLSDLALFLLEFQRELAVPDVPAPLVRALLAPLAWLGRRRGRPGDRRPAACPSGTRAVNAARSGALGDRRGAQRGGSDVCRPSPVTGARQEG
jgi:quercetin dioxygenase-like cupin family protein